MDNAKPEGFSGAVWGRLTPEAKRRVVGLQSCKFVNCHFVMPDLPELINRASGGVGEFGSSENRGQNVIDQVLEPNRV